MKIYLQALAVLVGSVAIVLAYDFQDPWFNSELDNELIELSIDKQPAPRLKRREHPNAQANQNDVDSEEFCRHRHNKGCCGKSGFIKSFDKEKNHGKECFREVNQKMNFSKDDPFNFLDMYSCERVKQMKVRHTCIHECIGEKNNLTIGPGKINATKVKEYTNQSLDEDWKRELVDKAIDKCISQLKEEPPLESDDGVMKCDTTMLQLKHCVWKDIEVNCPKEHQKENPKCSKFREALASKQEKH